MNPELLDFLRQANDAVRRGADPEAVSRRISEATNGQIPSLSALGEAVRQSQTSAAPDETLAAQERLVARGGSAVGDFARMAAQGATFGFADEIVGAVKGPEAMAESRQRVSDLRALAPGASALSEVAGGVAVPFFTGAGVAKGIAGPGAGVLARTAGGAAAGALAGGISGGLYGAGEGTGGVVERLPGAAKGAAIGSATGIVAGGGLALGGAAAGAGGRFLGEVFSPEGQAQREANRRLRQVFSEADIAPETVPGRMQRMGPDAVIADLDPRLAREARTARNQAPSLERTGGPVERIAERTHARGERLARQLREASGLSESMAAGQTAARRAVQDVREQHYHKLEDAFPVVEGVNVQAALQDPRVARVARRVAPDIVPDERAVQRAVAQGVPEDQARAAVGARPPSFTELQDVMMDLRDDMTAARAAGRPNRSRRASEAFDALTDAMAEDIPGFAEAQSAFRLASKKLEAYQGGFDAWTRSAREITETLESLPPEAHDSFRVGLLQRWEEKLLKKEGTTGAVNSILRAGDEMRGQIRAAFGSDEAFETFLAQRDLERTFRLTEAALQGNSTTAQQALDALDSAPTSKSELLNRIYDAVLSPGESRRIQAEITGERLLGRDVSGVMDALRPNPVGFGEPGAGAGLGGASGFAAETRTIGAGPRDPVAPEQDREEAVRAAADTLRGNVGRALLTEPRRRR